MQELLLLLLLSHFSRVRLCATPQTAAHQAPLFLGFSRQDTGVGCHFLLQCMKVKSEREVAQSCPTLRDPMDCSLPDLTWVQFLDQKTPGEGNGNPLQYSCLGNLMNRRSLVGSSLWDQKESDMA
ncbi:unnamed protein product [Rangifer tarandus platyrhynchus]|uniref:Uncharacterized protein n=1 Tax=Rangifer tarandus platyrhynchus TaxID=3082113 RepID=A0AC60A2Q7_RANTA